MIDQRDDLGARNAMANADVLLTIVDAVRDPLGSFEGLLPENWHGCVSRSPPPPRLF